MKRSKNYSELLHNMAREWKWVLGYVGRYKFNIFLYIFFGIIGTVMNLGSSVVTKNLIDVVVSHDNGHLFMYAAMVVGMAVFSLVFQSVTSWITAQVSTKTNNEIRNEIYSHILTAKWKDISRFHSGDLINRLEGDVGAVSSGVISFIPQVFTRMLQFFGSLAIVLYYDPTMAFFALLSAPFLFFSSRILVRTMRKFNQESRELNGRILSFSEESVQNLQVIKAFDLTKSYINNFRDVLESYRKVRLSYEKFSIVMTLCMSVIGLAVSYLCYGWGVYRLWQNKITYGTMTLFIQISGNLSSSFGALASLVPSAITIATSAGRIMELVGYETENDDDREAALSFGEKTEKTGFSVIADNVTFTYADGISPVLNGVDFEVHPGETIAFVGPSGEGKTTVLKLLLGLISPDCGSLTVKAPDGEALDISDSTRRFCSYVPQEMSMFSGTIRENLKLGKADASDEEFVAALKNADIWDFISGLPEGIDTVIGEHGANISQGQAQRIAIARALLRESKILLMDEATSALDIYTERRVLHNIMVADPSKVCIITTHRESMLKYCDRIYAIDSDGHVKQLNEL